MDLEIREFTQTIADFINKSKLPMEVKRLSLHDISRQLDVLADSTVQAQLAKRKRAEEEKQSMKKAEGDGKKKNETEEEEVMGDEQSVHPD